MSRIICYNATIGLQLRSRFVQLASAMLEPVCYYFVIQQII